MLPNQPKTVQHTSLTPRHLILPLAIALVMSGCGRHPESLKDQAMMEPMPAPAPVMEAASADMFASRMAVGHAMPPTSPPTSQENYQKLEENEVKSTAQQAISTLSLDVDTGSYANVRRMIRQGQLPPADAVRIEELLNYFPYADAAPTKQHPFAVSTELATSPWTPDNLLLRVGVKAVDVSAAKQPPANLVFLVDVSGSMDSPDKLPLAQASLRLLTQQLRPQDRVSMIVYAGRTAVELPSTSGSEKAKILAAIDRLTAGGSTAGEAALKLAYQEAEANMIKGGINRILLMTDGDFNVGISDIDDIKAMIEKARDRGVSLSTFGFGQGNYNEHLMEQVANVGNGNYSYIDSIEESQKVLGEELASTFNTVAKDVKLQVEFNPAVVKEWRLIGYENRVLNEQDFKNDKVDAAEIGAGKSVVALYELTPVGKTGLLADRRYAEGAATAATKNNELAFLRTRYKQPNGETSTEFAVPISVQVTRQPSTDLMFAAAVAGYGQLLKNSKYRGQWSYAQSAELAQQGLGADRGGYRADFVKLVKLTDSVAQSSSVQPN
ncbi:MAG: VWA domain-containing protein [Pseudomonadota bacterium]|nr:VWA domain-containing protein [Pseudomonadota bacterium]